MSIKNKSIVNFKSSEKLALFLNTNNLHKKDFAEMIGVTLSYVYNLVDETIPFSTRSTTLERIAVVMDVEPEEFIEYKLPQEPLVIDENVEFIKERLKEKELSTVQFLKAFPRKKRLETVDFLRGARPFPADWKENLLLAQILDLTKEEIYPLWEERLKQILQNSGFNVNQNAALMNVMFSCSRDYILK